jgi:hypothetical protein
MDSQGTSHPTESDTIEALTADRERMWVGSTTATAALVVFVVILLIGMAVFLL